jgi:hypothetical protein
MAKEPVRIALFRCLLSAFGAPLRDSFRISKQFRKGNSPKFVSKGFARQPGCVALLVPYYDGFTRLPLPLERSALGTVSCPVRRRPPP